MKLPVSLSRAVGPLALAVVMTATNPLRAQTVSLTADTAQVIRIVDERVFGANSVIWDGEASSAQTISLLSAAGLRTVRVPGGSLSDEYHWRVNRSLNNTWTWATSYNGFVKIITGLNAQAFFCVNYGTGTPEEAAGLVAYLNSATGSSVAIGTDSNGYDWGNSGTWAALRAASPLGTDDGMNFLRVARSATVGAKYWEIGNECYGTWETDQQAIAHDPTTYANRAQQYMAKMRAVDPTIKIGVVAVTSSENASYKNWTPTMLARLKTLNAIPDFLIYHRYPQAPGGESDAVLLQNASQWAGAAADLRSQLNTYLGSDASKVEVVVTENNSVFSNPGKQSTSLVNGLYLADSIANVMQTEIGAFMWWAIRNGPPDSGNQGASLYGWRTYGDYGMISTPSTGGATNYTTPYPTYYMMKLLSKFARGSDIVVKTTSGSNLLPMFAVTHADNSLSLLVLNKDPNNTLNASIALSNFTPASTATVWSYGKPQDDAAKPGASGSTDIVSSTMNITGGTFSASFAPYSATVITIAVDSSTPTTPPPTTPTTPTAPSGGGGGGGGGGAPSVWFLGTLALLVAMRRGRR